MSRFNQGLGYLLLALAVLLSVFQIWQGVTSTISATYFRPAHLTWVMVLIFLHYPLIKNAGNKQEGSPIMVAGRLLDLGFCALALFAGFQIIQFDYNDINYLLFGLANTDLLAGVVFTLLLLEACRRTVGWVMVIIAGIFLAYSAFGDLLPGTLATKAYSLQELVQFQIFSSNGIFGSALGIAATTVFIFVLFGAFLEVTGAGKFFIDLAFAIAGKYRGGPVKAAVIASAGLGSISGSAIANTVTTGSITIPMMKRLGYKPEQAAGIEAAASTGGQIMPPIMGAGAFVMAQFTGVPYSDIMIASIVPALLALPISVACGGAGIIVGVVGQTGIGLQFTQFVMALSGGYLFTALLLISLVALILGMGLPVTAAYIVLAVIAVPLLGDFGLPLLTSHLIIFWLSQTSNVTPPIALAAFAGAGVANAKPMKASVEAFKLAAGLFVIPMMMAYTGLINTSADLLGLVIATLQTVAIIVAMAMTIEGYLLRKLNARERLMALISLPLLLFNPYGGALPGLMVVTVLVALQWRMEVKQSPRTKS